MVIYEIGKNVAVLIVYLYSEKNGFFYHWFGNVSAAIVDKCVFFLYECWKIAVLS